MTLNVDPGYLATGIAIVIVKPEASVQVVAGYELRHRGKYIVAQMLSRRSHRRNRRNRRNRRSRIRRRPARFSNRRRTKDWLPPSLESTLTNILTTIRHLMGIYPISTINIESCKFDPRLLRDPGVHGSRLDHHMLSNVEICLQTHNTKRPNTGQSTPAPPQSFRRR